MVLPVLMGAVDLASPGEDKGEVIKMIKKTLSGVLIAALFSVIVVGCGGSGNTYIKPTIASLPVQDGQAMGSAKYPFAPTIGPGRFEVYYQGYGVRKVSGSWPQPSLRIQVSCENSSNEAIVFDTAQSHLVDNRGDVLRCSGAKRDGALAESFEEVRPHSHAQFDLFYDLKKGYPLEKLENFKVYWRYKGGNQIGNHSTMFVKHPAKRFMYRDEGGNLRNCEYYMAIQDGVSAPMALAQVKKEEVTQ